MKILIIEDNRDLAANIYDFLESQGHEPETANDGLAGLDKALKKDYDAIIMDVMMPGMDGFSACRKLRDEGKLDTPVLILTAKDSLKDKLTGFEKGADDYLVKPFAFQELQARLAALTRRRMEKKDPVVTVGDLTFDTQTLIVKRAGKTLSLTPTGLKILELLITRSPQVVSRSDIEHAVWGDSPPDSDALRAHMHTLRSAVDKPFDSSLIHTVHGIGFRLTCPDAVQA